MSDQETKQRKFSRWFRRRLFDLPMTQRDLALITKIDESDISRIIRGVRLPSRRSVRLMAGPLKCTLDELMEIAGFDKDKNKFVYRTRVERPYADPHPEPQPRLPQAPPRRKALSPLPARSTEKTYTRAEVEQIIQRVCRLVIEELDRA